MVDGARAVISFCILSAIPGYMVVPPERTLFPYKSLRMSMSHFMTALQVVSWTPADSIPRKDGWKRASGQRNLSFPMVMTCPDEDRKNHERMQGLIDQLQGKIKSY